MQRLETLDHLNDDLPDVFFFHKLFVRLALTDALETVSIIGKLHDNAAVKVTERNSTYHSEVEASSKKASLYAATKLFLMLAKMRTSLSAFSFSLSDRF